MERPARDAALTAHALARRAALALIGAALGAAATAQTPAARHYAVIALVGDELELVHGQPGVGSTLDRNVRQPMPDAGATFDRIALLALEEEIKRSAPGAAVSLLELPASHLHREPERLFDGPAIALPGSLVDAITQARATHVLLLTKQRGDTRVPMLQGPIGYGTLRGLGYYVDTYSRINAFDGSQSAVGLLAPFVYVRLTLADARTGAIVAQRPVSAARAHPVATSVASSADPWQALTPQQKVDALRALLHGELRRELPPLLAAPH